MIKPGQSNVTREKLIPGNDVAFPTRKKKNSSPELVICPVDNIEFQSNEEYVAHLAAIVEFSDDAIISKSLDGTIKSWNKGSERMFGYTAEEAVGKHIFLIVPPDYLDEEKKVLRKIREGEIIDHYETVRMRKNGERLCVCISASPLKDRAGNIIGTSKIARDITEQKKAEKNLEKSLREISDYKYALEESCILAITDQKGIIKYANDNFCKISKYNREELIGQDHRILNSGYHSKEFIGDLWLTIASGKIWRGELRNKAKDKSTYWVDTTIVPFMNAKGKPYQYVAIRADITKRKIAGESLIANHEEKEKRAKELIIANKELVFQNEEKEKRAEELLISNQSLKISEDQFKEVNDELESFCYSVSHDLRAPLRAIHGYSRMLKENFETQLNPEANRLMNNIMSNAKKMGQLIDDLLTFSRIGRKELVKSDIDMHSLVTQVCNELKNENSDRAIRFDIKQLLPAQADRVSLNQVWLNLISNAIKYSRLKDRAIIEIGSHKKGAEITYYIKDNGAGFDMRYADKLFGVFQRLHSVEEFEGTGVGLALIHRIVAKHGGRVWAEGKVDEGAMFCFTLN